MRSLDKDELLAQLAEKERRIKGHLDGLRDEGEQVTRLLQDGFEKLGGQMRLAGGRAQAVVPALAGGGLALWLVGRTVAGFARRRRPRRRLGKRELALLMEAIFYHVQHPGSLRPGPALRPDPPAVVPQRNASLAELYLLLLAAVAGAALSHVPWRRLLESLQGSESQAPPSAAPPAEDSQAVVMGRP